MVIRPVSPSVGRAMRFLLGQPNFVRLALMFAVLCAGIEFLTFDPRPTPAEKEADAYVQEHYGRANIMVRKMQRFKYFSRKIYYSIT